MRLSFCTDSLGHLPFEQMLDRLLELGVRGVEMTTGGWSPAPHLDADDLLANPAKRRQLLQALASRGMEIAALNVSGNPLDPGELGQRHQRQNRQYAGAGRAAGSEKDRHDERPAAGQPA